MELLACHRDGCLNIMCDRYSNVFGYICGDCFKELVHEGICCDVERFMHNTEPAEPVTQDMVYDFFEHIFPRG